MRIRWLVMPYSAKAIEKHPTGFTADDGFSLRVLQQLVPKPGPHVVPVPERDCEWQDVGAVMAKEQDDE